MLLGVCHTYSFRRAPFSAPVLGRLQHKGTNEISIAGTRWIAHLKFSGCLQSRGSLLGGRERKLIVRSVEVTSSFGRVHKEMTGWRPISRSKGMKSFLPISHPHRRISLINYCSITEIHFALHVPRLLTSNVACDPSITDVSGTRFLESSNSASSSSFSCRGEKDRGRDDRRSVHQFFATERE